MHIDALANGLGAQSMLCFLKACRRQIPSTVSLTGDTGWEFDRLWSNGRRGSSQEYFDEVVLPLAKQYGFDARFIRSVDKTGQPLPGLREYIHDVAKSGNFKGLNIPLFGSKRGQVTQRCTDKMKIRACRQELRRMGAKTARIAQGIHIDEAWRRVKGDYLFTQDGWSIYQTVIEENRTIEGKKQKVRIPIKWLTHYYPLVDLKHGREYSRNELVKEKIVYMITSECDGCPWKDYDRWQRTSPVVIDELSELEGLLNGEFFFTDKRIPLKEAIRQMELERATGQKPADPDFGCGNAECGV